MLKSSFLRRYMSRRFFQADTATATASAPAAAAAPEPSSVTTDFEMIGHLPGGELLKNAVFNTPDSQSTPDWQGPNQEDDEDEPAGDQPDPNAPPVDPKEPPAEPVEVDEPIPQDAPGLRKRVDKLTAQKTELARERDEAKAATETLKAEVARLEALKGSPNPGQQSQQIQPTAENPLAFIDSETDLAGVIADAEARKAWAIENFDGGDYPAGKEGGDPVALDAKAVRAMYTKADAVLSKHAPARRAYLERQAKSDDYIKARYPDYFDASKPEGQQFAQIANSFPQARVFPNWKIILADALRGQSVRLQEEQEAAAKTAKPGATPPAVAPVAPKVTTPPQPPKPGKAKTQLKANMSEEELAASLM